MKNKNIPDVNKYIVKHKRRSVRQRVLVAVAALVVFCTTYAMILPAITMEGKLVCGLDEHTHNLSCYSVEKKLVCGLEETEGHVHEENCYDNSGNLICTIQAAEPHTHTDECYEEKTILSCNKIVHTHSSSCYETTQQATTESNVNIEDSSEKTSEGASENSTKDKTDTKFDSKAKNNTVNSGATDFATYIEERGGTVTYKIVDNNNQVVDIDMASGEGYRFILDIDSPNGIEPGVYEYSYPTQIQAMEADKQGNITAGNSNDNEVVGTYNVDETNCVITLNFNENINNYQNFKGNLHFAVKFDVNGEEPVESQITKTGSFVEEDGLFHFKIEATIPSYDGSDVFHGWYIVDYSSVEGSWNQDLSDADIKITYGGRTYDLPEISEATADDNIAYVSIDSNKRLYLVNRCKCTGRGNCDHWINDKCQSLEDHAPEYAQYSDWCTCWNLRQNATLTIEYKNGENGENGNDLLKDYPDYTYRNNAQLVDIHNRKNNKFSNSDVPIPTLIEKTGTRFIDSNSNFIGEYSIVVNESMIDFSKVDNDGDGTPDKEIVIEDVMTDLSYVPGSINIVATDENSQDNTLVYGTDYKIDYTPGEQLDSDGNGVYESVKNIMNITLLEPSLGKYQYTITYKAQIIAKVAEGEPYNGQNDPAENTATLKIYSQPSDDSRSYYTFGEGWSYIKRSINIVKSDFDNPDIKLDGAVYGLYTEDGYEMAQGTTVNGGLYLFKTDVRQGIIFQSDKLYYIKELKAPNGYSLDTSKHWFYFSENEIAEFEQSHPGVSFFQATSDGQCEVEMKLTDEKGMELPETGGCGTVIYTIAGVILLCGAAYVLYKKFLRWKEVV